MYELWTLYYNRNGVSEGIDINKTGASKEGDICHYGYFLDKGFKLQPFVCKGSHDILMMSINLNDIAILSMTSAVLLTEVVKVMLQMYCKMLTWPRKEDYYKDKTCI